MGEMLFYVTGGFLSLSPSPLSAVIVERVRSACLPPLRLWQGNSVCGGGGVCGALCVCVCVCVCGVAYVQLGAKRSETSKNFLTDEERRKEKKKKWRKNNKMRE